MRAKYLLVHIPYSVTYGELQSRALRAWFVTNKLVSSWPGPPIMNSKRIKIELYCFRLRIRGFRRLQYLAALHLQQTKRKRACDGEEGELFASSEWRKALFVWSEMPASDSHATSALFLIRRSRSAIWNFREFCSKIASSYRAMFFTKRWKTLIFIGKPRITFWWLYSPEI